MSWLAPRWWPSSNRSSADAPSARACASWYAVALPSAPEPDDDVVDALTSAIRASRGSSQRRMSALSSSIGANQPCV